MLPAGQTFSSALGTGIKAGIKNIRDSFKPRYQSIMDGLEGLNVNLPSIGSDQDTNSFVSDLLDSLPDNFSDDNGDLVDAIQSVKSQPQSVPATQLISLWKGARDAANKATAKGNAFGVGADVQNAWRTKAKNLNKIASTYRQTMQDELPPDTISELNSTDSDYGQQVMPFYRSPYFSGIQRNGKVPANFIDAIAGNEPHQIAMQNLIKSDPELTRLALGQKYAKNPALLLQHSASDIPYISSHEPTANLLSAQDAAQDNLEQAQNMHDKILAQDPYQQGQIASRLLDEEHTQKMNDIIAAKNSSEQKTAALLKEHTSYTKKKNLLTSFAGLGLLRYIFHRGLFDTFDRRF